jgi:hypothetical protein
MPVQCGIGRQRELWSPDAGATPADKGWKMESNKIRAESNEMAIAVSITHEVTGDVINFAGRELGQVGEILSFDVLPKPGRTSITGGEHAYQLAEELAQRLAKLKKERQPERFHLFIAGPNGFQFHLGALSHLFGDCIVYEYDFEARKLGAYRPAISF